MRELKFRVWSKQLKKWLTKDEWYFDFDGNVKFIDLCPESTDGSCSPIINQDLFVIQQYIGLKDKNGEEIYEGDIVSVNFYELGKHICVIKYNNFSGCEFYLRQKSDIDIPTSLRGQFNIDTIKIIGNIFKNPELLKS